MFLRDDGQSFAVFKLLIAAIIALVILSILLSLLKIGPFFKPSPVDEIARVIELAKDKRFQVMNSREVIFQPNETITSIAIANTANVGLTADQICLSEGDFIAPSKGKPLFEDVSAGLGKTISYMGNQPIAVTFTVICGTGRKDRDVREIIKEYYPEEKTDVQITKWFGSGDSGKQCGCFDREMWEQTCCLVAVRAKT
jgi:hypothetical protein